jgi:hypothetical protein
MKRAILSSIIIVILNTGLSAQRIEFFKENITMEIEGDLFYVSGTYYFRYDLDDKKLIYYPFPRSRHYGRVDSVMIYDLTNDQPIKPEERNKDGLIFLLDFSNGPELAIQVSYRQEVPKGRAEYIIETTKAWRKPLEMATYQLIVPEGTSITSFSIQPGDSITTAGAKVFIWEKYNYLPEENLIFEFEKE